MGFTRTVEDFTCAHCGTVNRGNGYTNHCRRCLHSTHVDVEPGDRAADCGGLMAPVEVHVQGDRTTLVHRCLACGHEHRCRTSPSDDMEAVLAVARARPLPDPGRTPSGKAPRRRSR
jgi:RNHCP domain